MTHFGFRVVFGQLAGVLLLLVASVAPSRAATSDDRPWLMPDPILVIDPYERNRIDWDKLEGDRAVRGVIHRAYFGTRKDAKVDVRIGEARRRGFGTGIYLLGRRGDPIVQADLLIDLGRRLGVTLLALDIEDMSAASMTLADAQRFIERVIAKTGRAPLFYTNFSTYSHISRNFGASSSFAKSPLWLARFRTTHGMDSAKVWPGYTLWQFQSELNCAAGQDCFRSVAGTTADMDVNFFRGTSTEFRALFGGSR